MKLIDGEWLAGELFKHHVHDEDDLEPLVYLCDAQNLIATAPTIEAIPVEWLCDQILQYGNNGCATIAYTLKLLICKYRQEEQGASCCEHE